MNALPIVYVQSDAVDLVDAIEISCSFANMEAQTEVGDAYVASAIVDARGVSDISELCSRVRKRIKRVPLILLFSKGETPVGQLDYTLAFELPVSAAELFEALADELRWPLPNIPASLFLNDHDEEQNATASEATSNDDEATLDFVGAELLDEPLPPPDDLVVPEPPPLDDVEAELDPALAFATPDFVVDDVTHEVPAKEKKRVSKSGRVLRPLSSRVARLRKRASQMRSAEQSAQEAISESRDRAVSAFEEELTLDRSFHPSENDEDAALFAASIPSDIGDAEPPSFLESEKPSSGKSEKEIARLQQILDEERRKRVSAEGRLDRAEREVRNANAKAEVEEERYSDENETLKERVFEVERENDALAKRVKELQTEREKTATALMETNRQRDALRDEAGLLPEMEDEVAQLRAKLDAQSLRVSEHSAVEAQLFLAKAEIESLNETIKEQAESVLVAQRMREDAASEHLSQSAEYQAQQERDKEATQAALQKVRELEEAQKDLRHQVHTSASEKDEELDHAHQQSEKLRTTIAQLESQLERSSGEKNILDAQLETLNARAENLQNENDALVTERDAVKTLAENARRTRDEALEKERESAAALDALRVQSQREELERDDAERDLRAQLERDFAAQRAEYRTRLEEEFERKRREEESERQQARHRYRETLEESLRSEVEARLEREHALKRRQLEEEMREREDSARQAAEQDRLERERFQVQEEARLSAEREAFEEKQRELEVRAREKLSFRSGFLDALLVTDQDDAYLGDARVLEWEEGMRASLPMGGEAFASDEGGVLDPHTPVLELVPLSPLEGTFGAGEIAAVLWSAHALSVSGALEFRNSRGQARTLYLERGEPVGFDSELDIDRPEDALLYAGLLTKARYNEMRTGPHLSARHACSLLVDDGALKSDELFTAVRGVFKEQIQSLLEWSEGSFVYREMFAHAADRLRLTERFDAVLLEGLRRKTTVRGLWEALGGPRSIIGPDDRAQHLPTFSESEVEVARLFDGQRSLEDIVLDTGASEHLVLVSALALVSAGAARVLARGVLRSEEEVAERVEHDQTIDRARIQDRLHSARHGDYFSFLGVSENATPAEIKFAASRVRERFAPVKFPGPGFADLKKALQEIVEVSRDAEDVLRDENLRRRYTERLRNKRDKAAPSTQALLAEGA